MFNGLLLSDNGSRCKAGAKRPQTTSPSAASAAKWAQKRHAHRVPCSTVSTKGPLHGRPRLSGGAMPPILFYPLTVSCFVIAQNPFQPLPGRIDSEYTTARAVSSICPGGLNFIFVTCRGRPAACGAAAQNSTRTAEWPRPSRQSPRQRTRRDSPAAPAGTSPYTPAW